MEATWREECFRHDRLLQAAAQGPARTRRARASRAVRWLEDALRRSSSALRSTLSCRLRRCVWLPSWLAKQCRRSSVKGLADRVQLQPTSQRLAPFLSVLLFGTSRQDSQWGAPGNLALHAVPRIVGGAHIVCSATSHAACGEVRRCAGFQFCKGLQRHERRLVLFPMPVNVTGACAVLSVCL